MVTNYHPTMTYTVTFSYNTLWVFTWSGFLIAHRPANNTRTRTKERSSTVQSGKTSEGSGHYSQLRSSEKRNSWNKTSWQHNCNKIKAICSGYFYKTTNLRCPMSQVLKIQRGDQDLPRSHATDLWRHMCRKSRLISLSRTRFQFNS